MTTRITIDYDDATVTVRVTDDTGRNQTAAVPRYGTPAAKGNAGTETYVSMVDKLDVLMYGWDITRVCDHLSPRCGGDYCGEPSPPPPPLPTPEELHWASVAE